MKRLARLGVLAAVLSVPAGPATVQAEPLLITGGYVYAQNWDEFQARLLAPSFNLLVQSMQSGFTQIFYLPGDVVPLSSRVQLDNVELHESFEGTGQIDFRFTGGTGFLPAGPVPGGVGDPRELALTTLFTFAGEVMGSNPGGAVFNRELSGSGEARFIFRGMTTDFWEQEGWMLTDTQYFFQQAEPIPEPATLLLLTGGLSAAALRKGRRSRRGAGC